MWSEIKRKVSALEPTELVQLLGELYKLAPANQNFLNTRFGPTDLKPYLDTIDECMYPSTNSRDLPIKVALAKRTISDYLKATPNDHHGAAQLRTHFIERGTEFCIDYAYFHEPLCRTFLRMYISAIDTVQQMPIGEQGEFPERLKLIITAIGKIDEVFEEAFRQQYENSFPTFVEM